MRNRRDPANWCKRPAGVPSNSGLARCAWRGEHAHTVGAQQLFDLMRRHGKQWSNGGVLLRMSNRQMSRDWNIPLSSLRNRLRELQSKHAAQPFDIDSGKPIRRSRGDYGGVTIWLLRSYDEMLKLRRADPSIGKLAGVSRIQHCYVIGKGKRFLTPEEITAWSIDVILAERYSVREQIDEAAARAPETTARAGPPAAPVDIAASGNLPPPAAGQKRDGKPDFEPLQQAIIQACGIASSQDTVFIWREILKEAGGRQPVITVEGACEMVTGAGENWLKIGGGKPLSPGLLGKKVRSYVKSWQQRQAHRRKQEAQQAAFEKDQRINCLAEFIGALKLSDLPANERAELEQHVAQADPQELAQARALGQRKAAG